MSVVEVTPVKGFWNCGTKRGLKSSAHVTRCRWLDRHMSIDQQRLLACALARLTLRLIDEKRFDKKLPKLAVETCERFVLGLSTLDEVTRVEKLIGRLAANLSAPVSMSMHNDPRHIIADYPASSPHLVFTMSCLMVAHLAITAFDKQTRYSDYLTHAFGFAVQAEAAIEATTGLSINGLDSELEYLSYPKRLAQARMLSLFLNCDAALSETSKGLVNRWIHDWLDRSIDSKGIREILADSLFDDGVPEERCQWVRHVENWYLGMWPMTAENFVKGDS